MWNLLLTVLEESTSALGNNREEVLAVIGHCAAKATLLTWPGRRGVSRSDRRVFDEHKRPGDHIVDLYDRKPLAAPLRKL